MWLVWARPAGASETTTTTSVRHLPQMNETHGCPALHVHVLEYSFSLIPRSRGWTVDASDRTSTARCCGASRWVRRVRPRRPLARVTYVPSERGAGALQGGASVVLCPKQGVWGVERTGRTQLFAFGQGRLGYTHPDHGCAAAIELPRSKRCCADIPCAHSLPRHPTACARRKSEGVPCTRRPAQ